MMTPFVLRRKKAQVLKDLPQKLERIEFCDMTALQKEVYDEAIQRSRRTLTDKNAEELEELASEDEGDQDLAAENAPPPPPKRGRPKKKTGASTKSGNKADTSSSTHVLTDLRKVSSRFLLLWSFCLLMNEPSSGFEPSHVVPTTLRRQQVESYGSRLSEGGRVPRSQQGSHLRGYGSHDGFRTSPILSRLQGEFLPFPPSLLNPRLTEDLLRLSNSTSTL